MPGRVRTSRPRRATGATIGPGPHHQRPDSAVRAPHKRKVSAHLSSARSARSSSPSTTPRPSSSLDRPRAITLRQMGMPHPSRVLPTAALALSGSAPLSRGLARAQTSSQGTLLAPVTAKWPAAISRSRALGPQASTPCTRRRSSSRADPTLMAVVACSPPMRQRSVRPRRSPPMASLRCSQMTASSRRVRPPPKSTRHRRPSARDSTRVLDGRLIRTPTVPERPVRRRSTTLLWSHWLSRVKLDTTGWAQSTSPGRSAGGATGEGVESSAGGPRTADIRRCTRIHSCSMRSAKPPAEASTSEAP
mmetsp:Transcript_24225/g.81475  ORF Transcript_24225/g.81475 Transcript_24225/m.81475 type:complete len:305 (+) Transcript_24225:414-1328(+)